MLGGGSRPPQRLHHMLGGGWGVSRRAPPSLEAMCACSTFRGFGTVFGFSLFGRVGVYSGISQWYRVGDAGALRAEPIATLCLLRGHKINRGCAITGTPSAPSLHGSFWCMQGVCGSMHTRFAAKGRDAVTPFVFYGLNGRFQEREKTMWRRDQPVPRSFRRRYVHYQSGNATDITESTSDPEYVIRPIGTCG